MIPNRVLLVTDSEAKIRLGMANNLVWAVIQGCEGRMSSVSADEHVLCFPEGKRQMHGARGRQAMDRAPKAE